MLVVLIFHNVPVRGSHSPGIPGKLMEFVNLESPRILLVTWNFWNNLIYAGFNTVKAAVRKN